MGLLQHIKARVIGARAHRRVNSIVGSFEQQANDLDAAHDDLRTELASNIGKQRELDERNAALRAQRQRAENVRNRLREFVA